MGQAGAKPPLGGPSWIEAEKSRSLLKDTRGTGVPTLVLTYFGEAGAVIVLTYLLFQFGDSARRSAFLPWFVCSLLVFVLGAQWTSEMRVNKRLDGLLSLLTRKRLFDDEITDRELRRRANGDADGKRQQ